MSWSAWGRRLALRRSTVLVVSAVCAARLFQHDEDQSAAFTSLAGPLRGSTLQRPSHVPEPSLATAPALGNTCMGFAASCIVFAATSRALRSRRGSRGLRASSREEAATVVSEPAAGQTEPAAMYVSEADAAQTEPVVASPDGVATVAAPSFDLDRAVRRMWTAADTWHIHAITGVLHTVIGLVYIIDVVAGDVAALMSMPWTPHVSLDVVYLSMFFGAANAVSGLQASLLPRPFKDLVQVMGFGENGNIKSAGFINTAMFYFFLTYQSLRVVDSYPIWLMPLDGVMALTTLFAIWHAIYIINSYVSKGLSQGLAIGISAPLLLNTPVSLHLLFQGQSWVEQLSAAYPGWPAVFFVANYVLAWAGSMVTFVLSLYERRVITLTERLILVLLLGLVTFITIPLRAYVLVPEWFNGDWMVMLTLSPP